MITAAHAAARPTRSGLVNPHPPSTARAIASRTAGELDDRLGALQPVQAPHREGRATVGLVDDRALVDGVQRVVAERGDRHDRGGAQEGEAVQRQHARPPRARQLVQAVGGEQRRERERRELGEPRHRRQHAPPGGGQRRAVAGGEQGGEHEHGHERVVGVALQGEQRERVGHPRIGQRHTERGAAHAPAEQEHERGGQQVEEDRGGVRSRQVVPLAAPPEHLLEGNVHLVVDRPVRVAVFVVRRPAAIQAFVVDHLAGSDHARVADVDDVGVGDVERHAEAEQEHDPECEPARRYEHAQRCRAPGARGGGAARACAPADTAAADRRAARTRRCARG